MALTDVQNAFLKMQLANNPEFQAEYFPNVITQPPRGPLYNVQPEGDPFMLRASAHPNLRFDYGTTLPKVPSADMPKGPLHSIDPSLFRGEASTKGEFDKFGKLGSVTQYHKWPEYLDDWMNPKHAAQFTDVNVPYDTKDSRINIIDDLSTVAQTAPWNQYYDHLFQEGKEPSEITGGQTSAIYMNPEILASYGTPVTSPRGEMVNTPDWYKDFTNRYGMKIPETMDQAHINDVIESILGHEVGHGVSGRKEYEGITGGATSFDFSKFLPPMSELKDDASKYNMDYNASEYDQEELYNRMIDLEKLKRLSPNNYENHPLWDMYQRRAKLQFAELTGQKGHLGRLYPAKFKDYQKKIKPYVDAYLKKVRNRGISDINIAKEEIGMPQHLTLPPKKTYVAPLRGGGADVMPTPPAPISVPVPAHISGGNGGDQRGSMPTGTAGKNPWGRADGGLIDFYKYGGFIG
jgi:hypothetical protein